MESIQYVYTYDVGLVPTMPGRDMRSEEITRR